MIAGCIVWGCCMAVWLWLIIRGTCRAPTGLERLLWAASFGMWLAVLIGGLWAVTHWPPFAGLLRL
jgi:hypothetical protein